MSYTDTSENKLKMEMTEDQKKINEVLMGIDKKIKEIDSLEDVMITRFSDEYLRDFLNTLNKYNDYIRIIDYNILYFKNAVSSMAKLNPKNKYENEKEVVDSLVDLINRIKGYDDLKGKVNYYMMHRPKYLYELSSINSGYLRTKNEILTLISFVGDNVAFSTINDEMMYLKLLDGSYNNIENFQDACEGCVNNFNGTIVMLVNKISNALKEAITDNALTKVRNDYGDMIARKEKSLTTAVEDGEYSELTTTSLTSELRSCTLVSYSDQESSLRAFNSLPQNAFSPENRDDTLRSLDTSKTDLVNTFAACSLDGNTPSQQADGEKSITVSSI